MSGESVITTLTQNVSSVFIMRGYLRSNAQNRHPFHHLPRKARAACAQSLTLWQQATTEITQRDHSITACSRHLHMVLFFAHIPFVVNRAFNATPAERLQQCHYRRQSYQNVPPKVGQPLSYTGVARFNFNAHKTGSGSISGLLV